MPCPRLLRKMPAMAFSGKVNGPDVRDLKICTAVHRRDDLRLRHVLALRSVKT